MSIYDELDRLLKEEGVEAYNRITEYMAERLGLSVNPVSCIKFVPIERVQPNDYNPNSVAPKELQLLYVSIKHDGYTQPVVTYYDEKEDRYIIVDGFHRYFTMKAREDIYEKNKGLLPVVVIKKSLAERMASTVRHNRARGKHSIAGMSNLVYSMLKEGMSDAEICNALGMEPEELVKLKHITGFSKLFDKVKYNRAWLIKRQIELQAKYKENDRD